MKETEKAAVKPEPSSGAELDADVDDIFEDGEFSALADANDKESIRRDARRKIEIYWEKKRLREQFEDFDESEFGF